MGSPPPEALEAALAAREKTLCVDHQSSVSVLRIGLVCMLGACVRGSQMRGRVASDHWACAPQVHEPR